MDEPTVVQQSSGSGSTAEKSIKKTSRSASASRIPLKKGVSTLSREELAAKRVRVVEKGEASGGNKSDNTKKKPASLIHLRSFTKGASAAQLAQLKMIQDVFSQMDADGDGILCVADVKSYFNAINKNSSDSFVRKWIRDRDVDQDGAVSLVEFISSFAHQLDPASDSTSKTPQNNTTEISDVTSSFGAIRMGCSHLEVMNCVTAVEEYVGKILDSPSVAAFWRIPVNDSNFHSKIGRLFGGLKLMKALGFVLEDNANALALRDAQGTKWETVPPAVRVSLSSRLEELRKHKSSLFEPTISNIAAGIVILNQFCNYLI